MLLQFEANIHLRFISGANLIQSLSWKGIVDMRAAKIAVESIHDMYLMMMVVESGNAMQADFLECQHGTLQVSRANLNLQYLVSARFDVYCPWPTMTVYTCVVGSTSCK